MRELAYQVVTVTPEQLEASSEEGAFLEILNREIDANVDYLQRVLETVLLSDVDYQKIWKRRSVRYDQNDWLLSGAT